MHPKSLENNAERFETFRGRLPGATPTHLTVVLISADSQTIDMYNGFCCFAPNVAGVLSAILHAAGPHRHCASNFIDSSLTRLTTKVSALKHEINRIVTYAFTLSICVFTKVICIAKAYRSTSASPHANTAACLNTRFCALATAPFWILITLRIQELVQIADEKWVGIGNNEDECLKFSISTNL